VLFEFICSSVGAVSSVNDLCKRIQHSVATASVGHLIYPSPSTPQHLFDSAAAFLRRERVLDIVYDKGKALIPPPLFFLSCALDVTCELFLILRSLCMFALFSAFHGFCCGCHVRHGSCCVISNDAAVVAFCCAI
jgi:hypothetical protein